MPLLQPSNLALMAGMPALRLLCVRLGGEIFQDTPRAALRGKHCDCLQSTRRAGIPAADRRLRAYLWLCRLLFVDARLCG